MAVFFQDIVMANLTILLGAVVEIRNDDNIEQDLMDEYAYPNILNNFCVKSF